MEYLYAFIMGCLQGITEFLPISSSGHLVLFSRITGFESSLFFDLILHLGTLLAVIILYRKELLALIKKPISRPTLMVLLATAVTAVVVGLLRPLVEREFSGDKLPFFFMITAVVLVASTLPMHKRRKSDIGPLEAAAVGFMQGLAAFPGLSRSGLTVAAGNLVGLEKKQNTAFCFILSVPIILGSAIVETASGAFLPVSAGVLIIGFISSFTVGLVSLKLIKSVFEKMKLGGFAAYLAALSVFLLINDYALHLF